MIPRKWFSGTAVLLTLTLLVGTLFAGWGQLVYAESPEPDNLLQNGGYEVESGGIPAGWTPYRFSGNPEFTVDDTIAKEGNRSFRIHAAEPSRASLYQNVLIPDELKGRHFKFSQWIKTENVTGSGAFNRMFLINQNGGRTGDLIELKKVQGTADWIQIEGTIFVPKDSAVAGVKIENFLETGTGTAWFDDALLIGVESGPIGEEMVMNGDFEKRDDKGGFINWSNWIASGSPSIQADNEVYHSGQTSLRISAEQPSRAAVVQSVPLKPEHIGRAVKLQLWIKTEEATGGGVTRLQFTDSGGKRVGDLVYLDTLRGTNDWTLLERVVQIPDNAAVSAVKIENFLETGTGKVWFDDIRMVPWHSVEGIRLDQEQVSLQIGQSVTVNVYLTPPNASNPAVEWNSSNSDVASVEEGMVTAHSEGIAVIKAVTADGGHTASCVVLVGNQRGIAVFDYSADVNKNEYASGRIEGVSEQGLPLVYWKAMDAAQGVVYVQADGHWSYYPNDSFTGTDSFLVAVEDGRGSFAVSKVTVLVHPVNHAPVLEEGIQPTDKNTPVSGQIAASDPDGDPLVFTVEQQPQHGRLSMEESGKWTYTPNAEYVGADSFTVTASDPHGGTGRTIVRLYTAPTAEEIIAEIKASNPGNQHPRLLAEASDFERIRNLVSSDDRAASWFEGVRKEADSILPQPPAVYRKPDGLRLDSTAAKRVATLAFVYQITQDSKYAERAWVELEYAASDAYPDWSPQHFLDTATMTHGIALGYDWLYSYLSEEQRATVRQAIVNKGLKPAVPMYIDKTYWWVYNRDNWNFVSNGGMALGALAIADEEEQLAGLILREAFKSIQYGLTQYAPDGSAIEGPAYWEYGTISLVYFLSALETAVGHDYGFAERDGLFETPEFPIYIAGSTGGFNYSDNSAGLVPGRLLLWFANRFDKPEYTGYHRFATENNVAAGMYDLLWYRPEIYGAAEPADLDRYFGRPKAVTMRSSWNDRYGLFVGFKGGVNGAPHGDLDTGSFVFDAYGVRWAEDFGSEDYNVPGYWDNGVNGARWNYYRKRAEGHNTLVIQPSARADQREAAVSEIVRSEFNRPQGAFAITDMTPAYRDQAVSVRRGTALLDHRRQFLVQDEVENKVPSELYWFMHTRANIDIDDTGTSAVLSYGDKRLLVKILSPGEAKFSVMPAEPLPTSPNPSGQNPNIGVRKLAIHMEGVLNTTISVWMVPLMPGEPLPQQAPAVVPLDQWQVMEGELAEAGGITVDGQPVARFKSKKYVYEMELPADQEKPPVVNAVPSVDGHQVHVRQAEQIPGMARITVTDPSGVRSEGVYYIYFTSQAQYGIPADRPSWPIASVAASEDDGNVPENTIDGNLETRWSASGKQWISYDLGEIREVTAVSLAWYNGDTRTGFFNIEVSADGEQWTKVFDGSSSGRTKDHEVYPIAPVNARYVRVNGFGNNQNMWNSITETGIYGPAYELERVVLSIDQEEIKRKDRVPLEIQGYLNSSEPVDLAGAEIRYFTTDYKIARVEDGMVVTQKTGTAEIWAEVTLNGKKVASERLQIQVAKKNGNGPKKGD
ncbi:Ig-like domain-containing protein [Paenibacillus residui]|uniref:Ig-like domain-containing protein n=1 Tax=Paenibacillus residui TaxID=629724 RepID=A0ABW3D462_9BACL